MDQNPWVSDQKDGTECATFLEAEHPKKPVIAGFWIRFLSDFLDVVFLGLVGFSAAWPLKDVLYEIGDQGWWIGLLVTFAYAGFLQSAIGNGQTLAKKLLKIQVLKRDGTFMSLPESFLRYAVIAFIAYNSWIGNGLVASFPILQNDAFATAYMVLVLFCLCGVICIVPFHPLKQGLHDLLVDTVVVRKGRFTREALEELRNDQKAKRAYAIAASVCLIVVGGLLWFSKTILPEQDQMLALKESVERSTSLSNVGVMKAWLKSKTGTTTSFILSGRLVKSKFDDEKFVRSEAGRAVQLAVAFFPGMQNYDSIQVSVRSGFNIGISSLYFNRSLRFSSDGRVIAAPHLEEALRPDPRNGQERGDKGMALYYQERFEEAVPVLAATARRYPDHIETKVQLGDALVKTGHPEQAVLYFNEVLAKQPDHLYTLHCLGHALFILSRYQEAIVPLHHRVELAPEIASHHSDLGWALISAGRTAEGLAELKEGAYLRLHRQLEGWFSPLRT